MKNDGNQRFGTVTHNRSGIQKVDESPEKTVYPLEPNNKLGDKRAADATVILVNETIIEGTMKFLCLFHEQFIPKLITFSTLRRCLA